MIFFPSSACWHLISSKWFGMIFFSFSYQWHTPVAWRSNFRKGKICMAHIQQAASKPIPSKTSSWLSRMKMTDEHKEAAWPPPRSLDQAPQETPALVDSLLHCLFSWNECSLEMGAGIWAMMLLYNSFINVNMEIRDFDTSFSLVYTEIFFL